jgi:hypothetical protein
MQPCGYMVKVNVVGSHHPPLSLCVSPHILTFRCDTIYPLLLSLCVFPHILTFRCDTPSRSFMDHLIINKK